MPGNRTVRKPAGARAETSRVGKRGAIVVPARKRCKFGIEEGAGIIAEERDARDYRAAVRIVRKLGIDPRAVAHHRPPGR